MPIRIRSFFIHIKKMFNPCTYNNRNGMSAALINLPDVKYGCARDGFSQFPKSKLTDSIARKIMSERKLQNAN